MQQYNRNYTKAQVAGILDTIKRCVEKERFIISLNSNRKENLQFIKKYNLSSQKQKEILLTMDIYDFCYSVQNTREGFEFETLYVFCPIRRLWTFDGTGETVGIYIKFNIITYGNNQQVIAISLHKRKKPITYLFH